MIEYSNKVSESELEKRNRLLAEVFESTNDSVMITDVDVNIITVNKAFADMSGFEEEEVLGKNPSMLSSGRHDAAFFKNFWDSVKNKGQWEGQVWNRSKTGRFYLGWLRVSTITIEQEIYYVGITTDITELEQSRTELEYLAHHDSLTGLPNRLELFKTLNGMIKKARLENLPVAVFFLDLDNFKHINDSLGHEVGDELLKQISESLFKNQTLDFVARLGGDEFVIIPSLGKRHNYLDIAEKYIRYFEAPFEVHGNKLYSSMSLGISLYPHDATEANELVRYADIAMFKAKVKGRNRFEYFKPYMVFAASKRQQIELKFREALSSDAIDIFFQPQFSIRDNSLSGVEVLVRWFESDLGGWVGPGEFIPIVEHMGLIQNLGERVLNKLCVQMKKWIDAGEKLPLVSINVSSFQIDHADFLSHFVEVTEKYGLRPSMFEVEITESALILGQKKVMLTLKKLRDMGVVIAIDDFGTGYSSLSYLAQMPVQRIKIDKMFLRNLGSDSISAVLIRMIIALGNTLGISVIAEGVETEQQLNFLQSAGCEQSQGFYHSEAIPAGEFAKYLSKLHFEPEEDPA